jgi:hypothetical protein
VEYQVLERSDSRYPKRLIERLGAEAPPRLYYHGPLDLLAKPTLASMCADSISGAGFMAANQLLFTIREYELNYIGGWHSVMETEIFRLGLWRYNHTVTLFTAKGLGHETFDSYLLDRFYPPMDKFPERKEYFRRAEAGELLVLSLVEPDLSRNVMKNVRDRNLVACALSDFVFIPFAPKGSKTYALARRVWNAPWPVFTVEDKLAESLHELGIPGFSRRSIGMFLEGLGAKLTTLQRKTIAEGPRDDGPIVLEPPPVKRRNVQSVLPFVSDKPARKRRSRKP